MALIGTGAFLRVFFFSCVFSSTVIVQIAYLVFEVAEMSSTNIYFKDKTLQDARCRFWFIYVKQIQCVIYELKS